MRVKTPIIVTTLAIGIAAFALAASARGDDAPHTEITCSNVVSGATWLIRIDYGKATVDSYPARINDAQISWRDATDGGNYTLDRQSGKLTVIFASSTGGYFLHHLCRLEN